MMKCPTCREDFEPTRHQRRRVAKGLGQAYCSAECRPYLPHGGPIFPWTAELKETAVLFWLEGKSGSEIARAISTEEHELTRCAVMRVIYAAGARRGSLARTPPKLSADWQDERKRA